MRRLLRLPFAGRGPAVAAEAEAQRGNRRPAGPRLPRCASASAAPAHQVGVDGAPLRTTGDRRIAILLLLLSLLALPACSDRDADEAAARTGGDPARGREAMRTYGCASCHTIPGVPGADARVGPSLDRVAGRVYIAGVLENTPDNLARWIKDPPAVDPITAMPNVGATDADIRDIVAYLYTLK